MLPCTPTGLRQGQLTRHRLRLASSHPPNRTAVAGAPPPGPLLSPGSPPSQSAREPERLLTAISPLPTRHHPPGPSPLQVLRAAWCAAPAAVGSLATFRFSAKIPYTTTGEVQGMVRANHNSSRRALSYEASPAAQVPPPGTPSQTSLPYTGIGVGRVRASLPCTCTTTGRPRPTPGGLPYTAAHPGLSRGFGFCPSQPGLPCTPPRADRRSRPPSSLSRSNPQRIPVSRDLYWGNRGEGRLTLSRS